jgi:hypothetical protein
LGRRKAPDVVTLVRIHALVFHPFSNAPIPTPPPLRDAARLRPQAVASLSTLAELTLAPARVRDWRDAIRIIARDAAVDLPPLP